MKQVRRIEEMELKLNKSKEAIKDLEKALARYVKAQADIKDLAEYYESKEWKKDFEDDEKGKIPKDIKRGVLSEDGIYNLLDNNIEMQARLCNSLGKIIKCK